MRYFFPYLVFVFIISLLLTACSPVKSKKTSISGITESTERSLYRKAVELQKAGHSKEALELAEKAIKKYPGDIEILLLLSRLYLDNNQPARAEQYLEEALDRNPDDIRAMELKLTLMGDTQNYDEMEKIAKNLLKRDDVTDRVHLNALLALGDVAYHRDNDYDRAEAFYTRCRDISFFEPHVLFSLANVAAVKRQYEKNRMYLEEIEKNKDKLDRETLLKLYRWQGDSYIFSGNFDRAKENYLKVLRLNPDDYRTAVQIAYIHLHSFYNLDLEEGHRYLDDLPFIHPDDPRVAMVAGVLWRAEGRYYRALKIMENAREQALKKRSFQSDLWWTLADFYSMLGRYDDAEKLYREYINYHPDTIDGYIGLATCLLAKGDKQKAEKMFEKWGNRLRELRPHEIFELYLMKSVVYLDHLEDFSAAEKNLELFKKHAPVGNFEPDIMFGYLRLLQHRLADAKAHFEKAIDMAKPKYYVYLEIVDLCTATGYSDLGLEYALSAQKEIDKLIPPVRAAMYYRCAKSLYSSGEIEQAFLLVEKSAKIDPELPEAWILLSRLYRETDDDKNADMAIDRALTLDPGNEQALFEKKHPGAKNPYFLLNE
ncbi:MAG: tetratricopeptide repeat protein [Candidatus Eremiobacteraeota bacterium]|nr:tetratricopeptide repeat protein [Candidatus Eremiobacteraeota bacterium]